MNEETKKKIKEYAEKQKLFVSSEGMENIISDIEFGYSLAEDEILRLKELIKKAWTLDATQMTWEQFCEMNKL